MERHVYFNGGRQLRIRPRTGCVLALAPALLFFFTHFSARTQPATNCAPRPAGLIAWWPGDGTARDLVGTNDVVLAGGTAYAPGYSGEAFSFNGVDSYVANPLPDLSSVTNSFTIEFWARPNASRATTAESISDLAGTSGQRYAIYPQYSGNGISAGVGVSVGTNGISVFEHGPSYLPSLLVLNSNLFGWTHLAVTYSNKQPNLYVNGAHVRMGLTSPRSYVFASDTFSDPGIYGKYSGLLDEVSIYNRALVADEIAAIYAAGSAGKCFTNDPSPLFLTHPASQTALELRSATLIGLAMGVPRTDYHWLLNGSPLANATNNILVLTNLAPAHSGDYILVATNFYGSASSAVAQLTVLRDYNLPGRVATNCQPVPAGLIAWWPGDGTTIDLVGANHGALINGASYAPGKAGPAFKFDGVDDYLLVPHSTVLTLTNAVTMEAWIKSSNTPAFSGIIKKFSSDYKGYQMGLHNDATIRGDFGYGSAYFTAWHTKPVLDGAWHHIAATFDGTNAFIYVDGIAGLVTTQTTSLAANTSSLTVGNDFCCSGRFFNGLIDEPAVYSHALSPNQILALYAAGPAGKCFTNDPAPVIVLQPENQTGCAGYDIALTAGAMGVPRPSYQWLFNNAPLASATNVPLVLTSWPSNAGDYVLVASNAFGTTQSERANLSVRFPVSLSTVDGFEDGILGPCRAVSSSGSFNSPPGIKQISSFGSSNAFGFGRSTCGADCFGNFVSGLSIPLPGPTYVSGIRFKEMVLYENYGSRGGIYLDGTWVLRFGREPYNDRQADTAYRTHYLPVGRDLTNLTFYVDDITSGSELFIDDLEIRTGQPRFNGLETFESGWGDWWSDYEYYWRIRRPGNGPGDAHSGTNAACSNTGGNYFPGVRARLASPPFIVPSISADDHVILRFYQWYQYGAGDAGLVQILSAFDTNWQTLSLAATNGVSGGWQLVTVDLTSFQGQEVRIGFLHTANGDGSVGAGWHVDDVVLSQFVPTRLAVNEPSTQRFTTNQQGQFFVVQAPAGGHLRFTLNDLDSLGINEIYVRRGALPTAGNYDFRYSVSSADQSIFVPNADAGDWFIQAYNDSGPLPGEYALQVTFTTGVILDNVFPSRVGNSIPATITINGAGFDRTALAFLTFGGAMVAVGDVTFVSESRLRADFNLPVVPTNVYQLTIVQGTNSAALPFQVTQGGQPKLEARIIAPSQMGRNTVDTLYIEYKNTGDVAMPAPLLVLSVSDGDLLTERPEAVVPDFWTSAKPRYSSSTIQIMAGGSVQTFLQPGESGRTQLSRVSGGGGGGGTVRTFTLGSSGGEDEQRPEPPIDWASLKEPMRPPTIAPDAWEPIFSNFTSAVGSTWGGYRAMLRENAEYLALLGVQSPMARTPIGFISGDPGLALYPTSDLLGFEFAQADGLHIVRLLASATDAIAAAPGVRLSFERVFPNRITGRYRFGALGRGWSHNWEFSLQQESDGTVNVVGPAGSRRTFKPDRRGGYFNDPSDYATLASLGGGAFTLGERAGLQRIFRPDGKLDYIQDPNGIRITCGYTGRLLTRLAHSSNQVLCLSYNGAGFIESISDPAGRTNTFSYHGDHLISTRYFDGSVVRYIYSVGQSITREHALTEIEYPGGTHEFFGYDDRGRLASLTRDGGAEAVTFTFGSAGMVDATDALGNTTKFFLDHRGLLAKVENPQGNSARLNYDERFNRTSVKDPVGVSYRYAYDVSGNLIDVIDPLGNRTRLAYDAPFHRLISLVDANGNVTRYTRDTRGNLTAIIHANNTVEHWSYDSAGSPTAWTNRRGNSIGYRFSTNGQITTKLYPDGSRATYQHDSRGNLIAASNYVGRITLDYYPDDRLRRITYPNNRWLDYTYNSAGRRASMTDSLSYRIDYNYDAVGRLCSLTNSVGAGIAIYDYDVAGRLWRKTLGNGVYTTNAYDTTGQLLSLHNRKADGTLLSRFDYSYDSRGRRTRLETHYGVWNYEYDDLGQLTHAVLASTATNILNQDLRYIYDSLGNRLQTVEDGIATEYAVNNMNQTLQVGALVLDYDADGSLIQKREASTSPLAITNDFANRVVGFVSSNGQRRIEYDALGFPSVVWRNGLRNSQVHDPVGLGNLVATYDGAETLNERHLHGLGAVGTAVAAAQSFFTFDALGNVSDSTDASGLVTASHAFGPFGETIQLASGTQSPIGFGGEFGVVHEGDLLFMRARFYDIKLGRFISADPVNILGGDANLYRYARNNPLRFVDPLGLWSATLSVWMFDATFGYNPRTGQLFGGGGLSYGFGGWLTTGDGGNLGFGFDAGFFGGSFDPNETRAGSYNSVTAVGGGGAQVNFSGGDVDVSMGGGLGASVSGGYIWEFPWRVPQPTPPIDQMDSAASQIPAARDPNAKLGPRGNGDLHFVALNNLLSYAIHFENETNAPVPAQQVFITDQLTNLLDWQTFELTEIAFGDVVLSVPPGTRHFEKSLPMRVSGVDFDVQIEAGIRLSTGEVYATFRSIVPTTGLPPAFNVGFLPPNLVEGPGGGQGQGHIGYVIRAHTNLSTGTEIRNVALITFDAPPAIRTDQVDPHNPAAGIDTNKQALVTIDSDAPVSTVISFFGTPGNAEVQVCWSGSDLGSGIAGYDIYVATNGGPWTLWLANTTYTCATFLRQSGTTYSFYSIARDNTGQIEPVPTEADIIVPGQEPLLEAYQLSDGKIQLILYALPGTTNMLQTAEELPPQGAWVPWQSIIATNLIHKLSPLPPTNRTLFIRALRQ